MFQDPEPACRASDTSSVDEDKETSRRELERRAWEALQAARVTSDTISVYFISHFSYPESLQ